MKRSFVSLLLLLAARLWRRVRSQRRLRQINLLVSIVLPDCKSMEERSWRFEKFCYR
jgi:hypothetical protein